MQDIERSATDEGSDDQDVSEVSVASDLRAAPRHWSDEEKAWLVRKRCERLTFPRLSCWGWMILSQWRVSRCRILNEAPRMKVATTRT